MKGLRWARAGEDRPIVLGVPELLGIEAGRGEQGLGRGERGVGKALAPLFRCRFRVQRVCVCGRDAPRRGAVLQLGRGEGA